MFVAWDAPKTKQKTFEVGLSHSAHLLESCPCWWADGHPVKCLENFGAPCRVAAKRGRARHAHKFLDRGREKNRKASSNNIIYELPDDHKALAIVTIHQFIQRMYVCIFRLLALISFDTLSAASV